MPVASDNPGDSTPGTSTDRAGNSLPDTGRAGESLRREVAEFYQRQAVARDYVSQRYSGAAGQAVIRRELAIATSLLPPSGRVLDVACGIGRLATALGTSNTLVGVDTSEAMLEEARASGRYSELVQGDAFNLPFEDSAFDAAIALRLLFHFPDPRPILEELARVTRPGGIVVFETAGFSPRSGRAWDAARWGPKVFVHAPALIRERLSSVGLAPRRSVDAFLFSPYLYRRLPPFGVFLLERLEAQLPRSLRCRSFWQTVVGPKADKQKADEQVDERAGEKAGAEAPEAATDTSAGTSLEEA